MSRSVDPDICREEQISAEQEEGWGAWTQRALARLWAEHRDQMPYRDAAPDGGDYYDRDRSTGLGGRSFSPER